MRAPVLLAPLLVTLLASPAAATPRLGVVVVFDQLRSAELDRLAPLFGPGGFGGLTRRGAARFDARYPYAACETSPGHATLATGASPQVHGIVSNRWWRDGGLVYSALDPAHRVLGASAETPGRGPAQLRAGTLGDAMKADSGGRAKVVTLALKDRAAILMGGKSADLALWYEPDQGRFTTSTAYAEAIPGWAEALQPALDEALREGRWSPLRIPPGLEALFLEDDQVGEVTSVLGGRTFPHDLAASPDEASRRRWFRGTPHAVEHVFALALAAAEAEDLGTDAVPDLLVIGVSTTDYVGHGYGPLSLEMTDVLRRADAALRSFVSGLEDRYGRDGFVLAVTSDHGSTPLPERLQRAGGQGGRIPVAPLIARIEAAVAKATGKGPRKAVLMPPHLWLALDGIDEKGREAALRAAEEVLLATPGVAATFRPDRDDPLGDPFATRLRLVTYPGRSGALLVRPESRTLFDFSDDATGSDHGAPYIHDARVPLLLRGPGVRRGRYAEEVDPRDLAPTLAFLLSVSPPDACEGRALPAVGVRH